MSKNILFFISSLNGGAENQLYKLFELLKDENKARYVVAKAENSNSGSEEDELEIPAFLRRQKN